MNIAVLHSHSQQLHGPDEATCTHRWQGGAEGREAGKGHLRLVAGLPSSKKQRAEEERGQKGVGVQEPESTAQLEMPSLEATAMRLDIL